MKASTAQQNEQGAAATNLLSCWRAVHQRRPHGPSRCRAGPCHGKGSLAPSRRPTWAPVAAGPPCCLTMRRPGVRNPTADLTRAHVIRQPLTGGTEMPCSSSVTLQHAQHSTIPPGVTPSTALQQGRCAPADGATPRHVHVTPLRRTQHPGNQLGSTAPRARGAARRPPAGATIGT